MMSDVALRLLFEQLLQDVRVIAYPKRGTGEEHMTPDEVYDFARQKYDAAKTAFEAWMKLNH